MKRSGPEVIKKFTFSSAEHLLINVKMPTILISICRNNVILGLYEPENVELLDIFKLMCI